MKTKALVSIASLSLLILISLPSRAVSFRCNPNDLKALLKIKAALGSGNADLFTTWVQGTECCNWAFVDCLQTNRITDLDLPGANFNGQIPAAVGDLTYLETLIVNGATNLTGEIPEFITKLTNLNFLWLTKTNLSGPVPSFLSKLKKLIYLDLSFNNLIGSIPSSLSELQNLAYLYLSSNSLTGSIPSSLSQLKNLESIHLDRNKLTGEIPSSFGKFPRIILKFYLSHNHLSGSVPESLGNLNVENLDFSQNNLIGDLSFLFGKNKTVVNVDMSRNKFQFNLTNVLFPDSLLTLDLSHNKIYGSLPADLARLNELNVSYNQLCGQIPTGGNLQSFDKHSFFHNRCLCGSPLSACK